MLHEMAADGKRWEKRIALNENWLENYFAMFLMAADESEW
jgi:hypothetical protein